MDKEYISPSIEIIEFNDYICTSSNDEIVYMNDVQESSNGWLPWI